MKKAVGFMSIYIIKKVRIYTHNTTTMGYYILPDF